jgi:hypothetical protein
MAGKPFELLALLLGSAVGVPTPLLLRCAARPVPVGTTSSNPLTVAIQRQSTHYVEFSGSQRRTEIEGTLESVPNAHSHVSNQ